MSELIPYIEISNIHNPQDMFNGQGNDMSYAEMILFLDKYYENNPIKPKYFIKNMRMFEMLHGRKQARFVGRYDLIEITAEKIERLVGINVST